VTFRSPIRPTRRDAQAARPLVDESAKGICFPGTVLTRFSKVGAIAPDLAPGLRGSPAPTPDSGSSGASQNLLISSRSRFGFVLVDVATEQGAIHVRALHSTTFNTQTCPAHAVARTSLIPPSSRSTVQSNAFQQASRSKAYAEWNFQLNKAVAMRYTIELKTRAVKDVQSLSTTNRNRVLVAIDALQDDLAGDVKRLTDFTPEYRLRVGDYRVLFEVERSTVIIYRAGLSRCYEQTF
jgi:mRNA interferase RelE/StbE